MRILLFISLLWLNATFADSDIDAINKILNRSELSKGNYSLYITNISKRAKVFSYNISINYRNSYNMFISNGILFNHESPRRGTNFVTNKVCKEAVKIKLGLSCSTFTFKAALSHMCDLSALFLYPFIRFFRFTIGLFSESIES